LRVGIVGYPNIGKSTLINLIVPDAKAKVSSVSGTTRKTQWARSGRLRVMDSPGVIPFGDRKVQIGMTAAKDPHRIKNPEKVAVRIIEHLIKRGVKIYGIGASRGNRKYTGAAMGNGGNGDKMDAYEIFEEIGRKKGYLIKGGEVDENRISIKVIDDWQKGKISLK
jgi:ribosome biogenesis GTPase A